MTQIAQVQKIVKAEKSKTFIIPALTVNFQKFSWNGYSEELFIENNSILKYIELSFDKKNIIRLNAGQSLSSDGFNSKLLYLRGEAGGESYELVVFYR